MGIRWAGHVAFMGDIRKEYRILTEQPEGLRSIKFADILYEQLVMSKHTL
jgi:hypothetical protein